MSTIRTARRPRVVPPSTGGVPARAPARTVAVVTAAAIALLYLAIFAGVLSVGRSETGDLAILGVAGGVFVVLAVLLWRVRSRLLWVGTAALQLGLMASGIGRGDEVSVPSGTRPCR